MFLCQILSKEVPKTVCPREINAVECVENSVYPSGYALVWILLFISLNSSLFYGRWAERMNCWEYKNCAEEVFKACPAYPDSGSGCWMIARVKCQCGEKGFSSLDEQIAYCGRCGFYAQESARDHLKQAGNCAGSSSSRRMRNKPIPGSPDIP
jgi:hypothetical protein